MSLCTEALANPKCYGMVIVSTSILYLAQAVLVRTAGGDVRERTLRQLSGGERRRVGLALALGFAELIAMRSHLRTNLIVLDEVPSQP